VVRDGANDKSRVIVLLAAVVGLESADISAVGTSAPQLERAFGIHHAQLGLLVTVSLGVGAVTTIPFGVLADRARRVTVLAVVVWLWSAAMVATGAATSYTWLLVSRVGLGAVTAAGVPLLASFIGDFFDPNERSRIYSFILSGEFIGSAFGILISGNLAALSWRYAFWALALPGAALGWLLYRRLPEPERHVAGHRSRLSLRAAVKYVLSIPTNRTLIVASAVGYFFFAGLRTFALAFVRGRFDVGQSVATLLVVGLGVGALAGVLIAGRLADRLLGRGRMDARIVVPAFAYILGAAVLAPGLLIGSLGWAMLFFLAGAALLSAPNPPLDAARLDVVPAALWGRAESVRTVLRQSAQAGAPFLFGVIADAVGGSGGHDDIGGPGLRYTFLIMLSALAAAGTIVFSARRHYPRDAATATERDPTDEGATGARRRASPSVSSRSGFATRS
jgi:MFS family permease